MRMDGRTDRHDEANSRFSQFCERALKIHELRTSNCNTHRVTWSTAAVGGDAPERMLVLCALKMPCSDWRYETLHHRQKPAELCYRKGRIFSFPWTSNRIRSLLETMHFDIRLGKKRMRVCEIARTEHTAHDIRGET